MKLNLTVIFICVSVIVAVGIGGGVLLTSIDKDATAFYGFFTATLATVVAFGSLARSQNTIGKDVKSIEHKVNGRLSELIAIATSKDDSHETRARAIQIGNETGVINTVDTSTPVYDEMVKDNGTPEA